MKITGHKTESAYRRYTIVSDAELRDTAIKLARTHDAMQGHIRGHSSQLSIDSHSPTAQNS